MKYLSTFLAALVFLTSFPESACPESDGNIRVAVAQDKDKVLLKVKGPYEIKAINSDIVMLMCAQYMWHNSPCSPSVHI